MIVYIPATILFAQSPDDLYRYGSYRVGRTGVVIPAEQLRREGDVYVWTIKP